MQISNEQHKGSDATGRWRFVIGGLLIASAVIYLIISSTRANAQYYLTIDELLDAGDHFAGQSVRISGAVIGDTIQVDEAAGEIRFELANIPADMDIIDAQGGIQTVLQRAVSDPSATHLSVVYSGAKPDLLTDQAQAIASGYLNENGVFTADELLLKCPSRYEAVPTE